MGRLLVLGVLLVVMLGLRAMEGAAVGAHDPLILAAIGFVVMASYTAAELGSLLTLPRVSGYIAAGLLLGPSLGNILTVSVVEDMTMFNTLALGLIATGAGLELDLHEQRQLFKTLASTTAAKIVLAGGSVTGAFIAIESFWHPLGLGSMPHTVAVGLVLGTLAVGTSPSVTLAVINETGVRSRIADLTLGAAVLKDLVLVVCLAIVLAIGSGLVGAQAGHSNVVAQLATELGGSVVIGVALGALIIVYVRWVGAEMLLFVAGLVLAAAELSHALHLDLLLVFIAAGFFVRNCSKQWQVVQHAIETVALPVFVVFFTISGARINVAATTRLLPFALALCALRAAAFYVSARIGARVGGEGPLVRRWAWQAYLPQAGVTLGLLGLAVEELVPVGKQLSDIGLACIAVNLAIGPVTMRRAFQFAGAEEETHVARPSVVQERPAAISRGTRPPLLIATGSEELDHAIAELRAKLEAVVERTVAEQIAPRARALHAAFSGLLAASDDKSVVQRAHSWALEGHGAVAAIHASSASRAFKEETSAILEQVMPLITVPFALELAAPSPGDRPAVRFRKWRERMLRLIARGTKLRRVPLRTASRVALLPRLVAVSGQLSSSLCRTHSKVLLDLRGRATGASDNAQTEMAITAHLEALERDFRSDALIAIDSGLNELVKLCRDIDSPDRPAATLRYSRIEPEVRARATRLEAESREWAIALRAAEQALVRDTSLARLRASGDQALDQYVYTPLANAADALEPAVAKVRAHLLATQRRLREETIDEALLTELRTELNTAIEEHTREASARADLFRAASALHGVSSELRSLVDTVPEQLELLSSARPLHELADPSDATVRRVHLHMEARRELIQEFLPLLDVEARRGAAALQELETRIVEVLEVALAAVKAALEDSEIGSNAADDAIDLSLSNLAQIDEQARKQLIGAHDLIAKAFGAAFEPLGVASGTALDVRVARVVIARPLSRLAATGIERARTLRDRSLRFWRALLGSEIGKRLGNRLETPQDLRALLSRQVADAVPASYARLFRLDPERDLRLCVARDQELKVMLEAQARWKQGRHGSVLVTGDAGSGRTTLMNLMQPEILAARLVRPEAASSRRQEGLSRALAYELLTEPSTRKLVDALKQQPTAVLVDDLEHWFSPDAAGIEQLRVFLDLIRSTQRDVFWIVSVSDQMLSLVRGVVALEDVFSEVVRLQPFSREALRRVIESRHALSGMAIVYPSLPGLLADRVMRSSTGDLVYRALHATSGGNPSTALALWLNSVRVEGNRVHVLLDQLLSQRLPHLSSFDASTTALLVQLLRFGPMTPARLAESLGLPAAQIRRRIVRLENAGLLRPSAGREFRLASEWRGVLAARLPTACEWR